MPESLVMPTSADLYDVEVSETEADRLIRGRAPAVRRGGLREESAGVVRVNLVPRELVAR
jgi:hypothetical protein